VETGSASYLQLNDRSYRGKLEIYRENGRERLLAINVLDMEDYLRGVIREEISPQWPMEALKAQAVVARTFALRQILDNPQQLFHLKATPDSQMYGGRQGEDFRCDLAVKQTEGLVLAYRGNAIPAFYHAACGGHTEDAADVWSYNHSSLQGVPCSYCQSYPVYAWQASLKQEDIRRALGRWGYQVAEVEAIVPLQRSKTNRILQLEIRHGTGRIVMEGKRLRQCLGYDLIRSTNFSVRGQNGSFTFQGRGWGHGVGLCQWGAKGMAERACPCEAILQHYYPGTRLARLEETQD
jgi:stage II sporulation protein D